MLAIPKTITINEFFAYIKNSKSKLTKEPKKPLKSDNNLIYTVTKSRLPYLNKQNK